MQADALAGLLRAARHDARGHRRRLGRVPRVAAHRGPPPRRRGRPRRCGGSAAASYGLMALGMHYCGGSLDAAWSGGMEAVVELPEWAEVLERNPANRQRFLDQDPKRFIATMERWMVAYCPCGDELVPGLPDADARGLDLPALVFRSGASDVHHTRATSEQVAELLPERPAGRAAVGRPGVDRAPGRPDRAARPTACSSAGPCSPPPCRTGRPKPWADQRRRPTAPKMGRGRRAAAAVGSSGLQRSTGTRPGSISSKPARSRTISASVRTT